MNSFSNLKTAALFSCFLVIPFIGMELLNGMNVGGSFPLALFLTLWALSTIFGLLMIPLVTIVRQGGVMTAPRFPMFMRLTASLFVAWLWTAIVLDQMPCFMGVPNCD